jgi:uncharacterized protein with HEPN domain
MKYFRAFSGIKYEGRSCNEIESETCRRQEYTLRSRIPMKDHSDALEDVIHSMKLAIEFTEAMNSSDFNRDEKTQYAVIRCLEIIGEATKRLPEYMRNEKSEVPWKAMAGMRDRLIHGYDIVDTELVWKTTKDTLPLVLKKL